MDSSEFCGQVCHAVMAAGVRGLSRTARTRASACVQCHIGPGAPWFVQVEDLRHAPGVRGHAATPTRADPLAGAQPAPGARHLRAVPLAGEVPRRQDVEVIRDYADDEKNTESDDDAARARRRRQRQARHRDRHPLAHERRQRRRVHRDRRQAAGHSVGEDHGPRGQRARVSSPRASRPTQLAKGERRRMDCIDCHNRPSHPFAATPERAVNRALADGRDPDDAAVHQARSDGRAQGRPTRPSTAAEDAIAAAAARVLSDAATPSSTWASGQDVERAVAGTQALYQAQRVSRR